MGGRAVKLTVKLIWPPSSLSGHAKGKYWWSRSKPTNQHRAWGAQATLHALAGHKPVIPPGDIPIRVIFIPPDRRGDRMNYPNRVKAGIDGIAEALGVNDKRFKPSYEFREPEPPGCVLVEVTL